MTTVSKNDCFKVHNDLKRGCALLLIECYFGAEKLLSTSIFVRNVSVISVHQHSQRKCPDRMLRISVYIVKILCKDLFQLVALYCSIWRGL